MQAAVASCHKLPYTPFKKFTALEKGTLYVTVSVKTLHVSMQILAYFSTFEIS